MRVAIYIEGAGNRELKQDCRRAFRKFLRRFVPPGSAPTLIPCGSREDTFDKFRSALRDDAAFPILLVDSEGPVAKGDGPWSHLRNRQGDNWSKPSGATDDHAHMMVECMENWFLADQNWLATYFKDGFNANPLPKRDNVEQVSKADAYRALRDATKGCAGKKKGKSEPRGKGQYGKGKHSFEILEGLNARLVYDRAKTHGKRFFDTLKRKLEN